MLWEISIVKLPNYLNVTVHCISANCNIQKTAWKILLCEVAAAISDVILSLKTPHYSYELEVKIISRILWAQAVRSFSSRYWSFFGTQRIQDFAAVGVGSRHHKIVSGSDAFCGGGASISVCCGPVGHDDARKAPFLSCSGRAQIVAVGGVDTVYLVVGGHDRLWLGFFDCNFEALQIDLTQSALGDDARYAAAVFFPDCCRRNV